MKHKNILRAFSALSAVRVDNRPRHREDARSVCNVSRGDRFAEWTSRGLVGEEDVVDYIYISNYSEDSVHPPSEDVAPGFYARTISAAVAIFDTYASCLQLYCADGTPFLLSVSHECRVEGRGFRRTAAVRVEEGTADNQAVGSFHAVFPVSDEEGARFLRAAVGEEGTDRIPAHILADWLQERCGQFGDFVNSHGGSAVRVGDLSVGDTFRVFGDPDTVWAVEEFLPAEEGEFNLEVVARRVAVRPFSGDDTTWCRVVGQRTTYVFTPDVFVGPFSVSLSTPAPTVRVWDIPDMGLFQTDDQVRWQKLFNVKATALYPAHVVARCVAVREADGTWSRDPGTPVHDTFNPNNLVEPVDHRGVALSFSQEGSSGNGG